MSAFVGDMEWSERAAPQPKISDLERFVDRILAICETTESRPEKLRQIYRMAAQKKAIFAEWGKLNGDR